MKMLTALLIQSDPSVTASAIGPINGKFGIHVEMIDKAPSGFERQRTLLTSDPIYETADAAILVGQRVIDEVRSMKLC